jgi:hypothetical protein
MIRRSLAALLLVLLAFVPVPFQITPQLERKRTASPAPVVIPFEFVTRHILIRFESTIRRHSHHTRYR